MLDSIDRENHTQLISKVQAQDEDLGPNFDWSIITISLDKEVIILFIWKYFCKTMYILLFFPYRSRCVWRGIQICYASSKLYMPSYFYINHSAGSYISGTVSTYFHKKTPKQLGKVIAQVLRKTAYPEFPHNYSFKKEDGTFCTIKASKCLTQSSIILKRTPPPPSI